MAQSINWILIIAGALFILLEVLMGAITGFDLLLLGSAILFGGLIGLLSSNAGIGLISAGVLSLLYIVVGRKKIRSRLKRPGLRSNTDALIGRTILVSETITSDRPGRVQAEGEEWRALLDGDATPSIEKGSKAVVARIDGVTVYVVPPDR